MNGLVRSASGDDGGEPLPVDEAGEYVLGVLDEAERKAIERRSLTDRGLAAAIARWETSLAPLASLVEPRTPPAWIWRRLALSITEPITGGGDAVTGPGPEAPPRSVWANINVWRASTAAALAIAASLALMVSVDQGRRPVGQPIAFVRYGDPDAAFVATRDAAGSLVIRAVDPASVPTGRNLQLWAMLAGQAKPVAVALLPAGGRTLAPREVPSNVRKLLVSLEPQGGSPTGLPTGPVLYAATPH